VFVTGLVLAAGGSTRLGAAKQLLPYRGRTLLDATLDMARACDFDQIMVTLGGSARAVRNKVDVSGTTIVECPDFGAGCGASISTAARATDVRVDAIVLMLGDQPGVRPDDVRRLIRDASVTPIGVCSYDGGLSRPAAENRRGTSLSRPAAENRSGPSWGHPIWLRRETFGELANLHGDKAVWKLLHSGAYPVTEVAVDRPVPIDVDTRADYERLLAGDRAVP
jgi:molybdenum cofactor cytidylyltransferase